MEALCGKFTGNWNYRNVQVYMENVNRQDNSNEAFLHNHRTVQKLNNDLSK